MELFINNKSGAPIYDQIYNQIKQQIISGALQPDETMPFFTQYRQKAFL